MLARKLQHVLAVRYYVFVRTRLTKHLLVCDDDLWSAIRDADRYQGTILTEYVL